MTHTWDTYRGAPNVDRCRACGLLRRTFRVAGRIERQYFDPSPYATVRHYARPCVKKEVPCGAA